MKFKVKVLMLLVSMLFGALGVSAQIANGQYKLKTAKNIYLWLEDPDPYPYYITNDEEKASVLAIESQNDGTFCMKIGDKYVSYDGYDVVLSDGETKWVIQENNGGITIHHPNDSEYGYIACVSDMYVGLDEEFVWQYSYIGPLEGGDPTPTYAYKVILNGAPAGKTITVGSAEYGNGETFSSTSILETGDIKNYTHSGYRVETPVISENTTDNDVNYDITINYHRQYTYQVYLNGAPSGTKIRFDGEEKSQYDYITIEYELTDANVKEHVDATLSGYQTQVSMWGNRINVVYTRVFTYTINFVDAPDDATLTIDGIDGTFDKDHNTFDTTNTIGGTNLVHPKECEGYKVSVDLNNTNYTITVTYVQGYDYTVHITVVPANSTGTFNIGVDPSHGITEGGSNLVDGSTFVSTNALSATLIRPRESYSHLCYKVLDNEQHEVNITYVLTSSLQSGKYYRFGHNDYKLKAAPNQVYNSLGNETPTELNAVVDIKTDYNDLWLAENAGTYNYKYLRHANSGLYLGKLNNNTLTLVESADNAGQFILNSGSLLEVSEENYLTQGALTQTKTSSAWNKVGEATITLPLNDYGYATTCMPFNFTVSEGAEIYGTIDVHDYSGYTTLKVHQVEGVAQAGQGYIIKGEPRAEGEPQKTVTLTPTTEEADDEAESSMLGTLIRQTGVCTALGYDYYGFKGDEFVLASSENIPANKAVYIPASASSVMKMSISLDEDLTTGILGLTSETSTQQPIYDLQGRSCMRQSQKGLYIQGGHKMIRR